MAAPAQADARPRGAAPDRRAEVEVAGAGLQIRRVEHAREVHRRHEQVVIGLARFLVDEADPWELARQQAEQRLRHLRH